MKTHPVLFSTPMVQANLAKIKTQTRRIVKPQPEFHFTKENDGLGNGWINHAKYKIGDILWVREPAKIIGNHNQFGGIYERSCDFQYSTDGIIVKDFTIPHRFTTSHINQFLYEDLPPTWLTGNKGVPNGCLKEMARIFLKVTNVRVERLKDISEEDAIAEGIEYFNETGGYKDYLHPYLSGNFQCLKPTVSFMTLWKTINGRDSWDANPWVWVYDYEHIDKPENF